MSVSDVIKAAFGRGRTAGASLPMGLSPAKWIELSDKLKPRGYRPIVQQMLRYYWGLAQDDTLWALRRTFPKTADYMTPVNVPTIEYVIRKQASVFSGEPDFALKDDQGNRVESTYAGVRWGDVLRRAELQRHLQQANRLTRLCKRAFVRVTWDDRAQHVKLATFTPDQVHVLFRPDSRNLDDALGVLLEIEPELVGEELVNRWEFWSGGEEPQNFIIDEHGNVTGVPDENGALSFGNPYVDEHGRPMVPIVSFADEDSAAGYWLLPRQSLLAAQQAIDVDQTTLKHVARLQGFGQWVSEVNPNDPNPEEWSGEPTRGQNAPVDSRSGLLGLWGRNLQRRGDGDATVTMGPDVMLQVPKGRTVRHEKQEAAIAEQVQANDRFLKQLLTMESIPPGELLGEPTYNSGFALLVERLSLTELRTDQIALYQHPAECVLRVVRTVWDAHQPDDSLRFGPCRVAFTADGPRLPQDPAAENASDQFELTYKLNTRANIIARRQGCTLEEAHRLMSEIDAEPALPPAKAPLPSPEPAATSTGGDATEPETTQLPPDEVQETPAADPFTGSW